MFSILMSLLSVWLQASTSSVPETLAAFQARIAQQIADEGKKVDRLSTRAKFEEAITTPPIWTQLLGLASLPALYESDPESRQATERAKALSLFLSTFSYETPTHEALELVEKALANTPELKNNPMVQELQRTLARDPMSIQNARAVAMAIQSKNDPSSTKTIYYAGLHSGFLDEGTLAFRAIRMNQINPNAFVRLAVVGFREAALSEKRIAEIRASSTDTDRSDKVIAEETLRQTRELFKDAVNGLVTEAKLQFSPPNNKTSYSAVLGDHNHFVALIMTPGGRVKIVDSLADEKIANPLHWEKAGRMIESELQVRLGLRPAPSREVYFNTKLQKDMINCGLQAQIFIEHFIEKWGSTRADSGGETKHFEELIAATRKTMAGLMSRDSMSRTGIFARERGWLTQMANAEFDLESDRRRPRLSSHGSEGDLSADGRGNGTARYQRAGVAFQRVSDSGSFDEERPPSLENAQSGTDGSREPSKASQSEPAPDRRRSVVQKVRAKLSEIASSELPGQHTMRRLSRRGSELLKQFLGNPDPQAAKKKSGTQPAQPGHVPAKAL